MMRTRSSNKAPIPESVVIEDEADSNAEQIEITINPELNKVLKKKIELKRKSAKETPENNSECTDCNLKFSNRKFYVQHMKKHNMVRVCKICGTKVPTRNYRYHVEDHKSSPQVCELCGVKVKNAASLRGHIFYMHKSSADQYKCKDCDKFFRSKCNYQLHVRKAHGGDKTHICEVCGKAFYTNRDVNDHIKMTHMQLRPFICEYCNKAFRTATARRIHVRLHTNERPFKCEICGEGFIQKVSLTRHLRSHHGITEITEQSTHTSSSPKPKVQCKEARLV